MEDPVEANIDGINQIQMNPKAGLSFANTLRYILRQDPDVIMIGEIRDQETASIAIQASITGHLVASTLHTNSTVGTITRLIDMGIEQYLLADSLVGVIAQRLVRRLCEFCKISRQPTQEEILLCQQNNVNISTIYDPCGCIKCDNTGYRGRIGVYEIMNITPKLKRIISRWESEEELKKVAVLEGMHTLKQGTLELVRDGVTSYSEYIRVSYEEGEI